MSSRIQIEQLTVEGLRDLARQVNIEARGNREQLVDRLMDHFESSGWPEHVRISGRTNSEESTGGDPRTLTVQADRINVAGSDVATTSNYPGNNVSDGPQRANVLNQDVTHGPDLNISSTNMQDLLRAFLQILEERSTSSLPAANLERLNMPAGLSPRSITSERASGYNNWNEINFISKLIPVFSGKDDENVERWIQRVVSIGQVHRVSNETLVLAAVNQLGVAHWISITDNLWRRFLIGRILNFESEPISKGENHTR